MPEIVDGGDRALPAGLLGCALLTLLLLLAASIAHGQPAAQTFDQLRSRIAVGETVTVTDVKGRDTRGTLAELSSASLALMVGGTRTEFFEADVETVSKRDSRWNGTLWGLGVGGLIGVVLDRSFVDEYGREDISVGSSVAFVAFAAGIGAASGFGIDSLIKGRRLLYTRPRTSSSVRVLPVWNPERMAIVASLEWR
jgi:hypothetical protein